MTPGSACVHASAADPEKPSYIRTAVIAGPAMDHPEVDKLLSKTHYTRGLKMKVFGDESTPTRFL
ncbi:hypothetical protein PGTUg99_026127 [Puccinia graminis f. sp. tritici]|uniref:Uncharacterized protein n=1 Tax=Puccinia graminis f. sp. tritici TaxID=56615 RepID=A0A5B0N264_PUCGR|nr:hypothetical protein PGTUg99_026127 [Puccinia graminis f. sp. tritici]